MKIRKRISTPEKLDKYLHATNPFTWISLGLVLLCLLGLTIWAFVARITYKISGKAAVSDGTIILNISDEDLKDVKKGQKVYVSSEEAEIIDIDEKGIILSTVALEDGEYDYEIIIKIIRPIDYFANK